MAEMRRHLLEAIALNKERKERYAKLTGGKSIRYSNILIWSERLALISALFFDLIGNYYQRRGVKFIQAAFVEMSLAPVFQERYPAEINYQTALELVSTKPLHQLISKQLKNNDFQGVVDSCNYYLEILSTQPAYYCMLRHLIESIRRIAFLQPLHAKKCKDLDIRTPIRTTKFLLRSHLLLLNPGEKFDLKIASIQQTGVPILYQDLPPIGLENPY